MKIPELIPTHNSLRDPKSLRFFIDFIRDGRVFRAEKKPIVFTQFEDGKVYVHDGHHRIAACVLCNVSELWSGEYILNHMYYADYTQANPNKGWFTPFNPRVECRVNDFADIKECLSKKYRYKGTNAFFNELEKQSKSKWAEERKCSNFSEMIMKEGLEKYLG